MTRLPVDRGQTEPIAALVAVSALAIGIGVFASYYTGVLPGTTERTVEEPTLDQVWTHLEGQDGESGDDGVYETDTLSDHFTDDEDRAILPQGWVVYVNVTWRESDGTVERDAVGFDRVGARDSDIVTYVHDNDPPDGAGYASRPVPVKYGPADVRGGRLHVVVWQN